MFKNMDKKWKEYALAGCCCVLFFVVLTHLSEIFQWMGNLFEIFAPVITGIVIACILNPLAVFMEKKILKGIKSKKAKWVLSVIITLLIFILLICFIIAAIIPQVVENIVSLMANSDSYIESLNKLLEKFYPQGKELIKNLYDRMMGEDGILINLGTYLAENLSSIAKYTSAAGSKAMKNAIGMIFAVYFLMAKESIFAQFRKFFSLVLSAPRYFRAELIVSKFGIIFSTYIVCQIIDSIIIITATYIFMLITKMPDIAFISFVAGITNLIPTFGPVIGGVIAGFVLLLLQPSAVITYVIFVVIIQLLDGYVIKPKLFGGALNVPGVVILISIIVFGNLMGVAGMLLAIPFAAIIVYIYADLFIPWLELRQDMKKFNKEQNKNLT